MENGVPGEFRGRTHGSRGVAPAIEGSVGVLPLPTRVDAWDSSIDKARKRDQRSNGEDDDAEISHIFLLSSRERERER